MQYGRSGLVGRNPDVLSALTDQPRLTKQAGEKDRPGTITLCQMRRLSGIPTKRESALHEDPNFTDRHVCLQAVFRIATFPIFNRYPFFSSLSGVAVAPTPSQRHSADRRTRICVSIEIRTERFNTASGPAPLCIPCDSAGSSCRGSGRTPHRSDGPALTHPKHHIRIGKR